MTVPELIRERDQSLEKLRDLGTVMLLGSASATYRTCGNPSCRCHHGGPKHGPNVYVNYRGEHGKTTGYYVPKALHETVNEGLDAWKEFQALAKRVAQLNEQILRTEKTARKGASPKH